MASEQASLLLRKQLKGKNNNHFHFYFNHHYHYHYLIISISDLAKCPVDGFSAGLVDENNIYEWDIMIIGPPETL